MMYLTKAQELNLKYAGLDLGVVEYEGTVYFIDYVL